MAAEVAPRRRNRGRVAARLGALAMLVVGAGNLVLAVWSLVGESPARLGSAAAVGVVVGSVATIALALAVWRGSRPATVVSLSLFAVLLVTQLGAALSGDVDAATAWRVAILGVLVAVLAVASATRRRG